MHPLREHQLLTTRRQLFGKAALGLGTASLATLLQSAVPGAEEQALATESMGGLHHAAKAKTVIYLFMSGGPSHLDMWDYKPQLSAQFNEQLPDAVRDGQRIRDPASHSRAATQGRLGGQRLRWSRSRAFRTYRLVREQTCHTARGL